MVLGRPTLAQRGPMWRPTRHSSTLLGVPVSPSPLNTISREQIMNRATQDRVGWYAEGPWLFWPCASEQEAREVAARWNEWEWHRYCG